MYHQVWRSNSIFFFRFIYYISYDAHNKQHLISCTTVTGLPTGSNCVLCEVKTEARVLPQAASRRPLSEEARVQSQLSLCEVCGAQSGTTPDFSPSTSFFPRLNHSANAPYSSSLTRCTYQEDKRAKSGNLPKKQMHFRMSGGIRMNTAFEFLVLIFRDLNEWGVRVLTRFALLWVKRNSGP